MGDWGGIREGDSSGASGEELEASSHKPRVLGLEPLYPVSGRGWVAIA